MESEMMITDESWKFSGALYVSKGKNDKSAWSAGFMISFFSGLSMLICQQTIGIEGHEKEMVILGIFFAIGVVFTMIGSKKNAADSKIVYFAIFKDYIMLLPTNKPSKNSTYDSKDASGYVRIRFEDIAIYKFTRHYTTDSDGVGRSYENYGKLEIKTKASEYATDVKDIRTARELFWEFLPYGTTHNNSL